MSECVKEIDRGSLAMHLSSPNTKSFPSFFFPLSLIRTHPHTHTQHSPTRTRTLQLVSTTVQWQIPGGCIHTILPSVVVQSKSAYPAQRRQVVNPTLDTSWAMTVPSIAVHLVVAARTKRWHAVWSWRQGPPSGTSGKCWVASHSHMPWPSPVSMSIVRTGVVRTLLSILVLRTLSLDRARMFCLERVWILRMDIMYMMVTMMKCHCLVMMDRLLLLLLCRCRCRCHCLYQHIHIVAGQDPPLGIVV